MKKLIAAALEGTGVVVQVAAKDAETMMDELRKFAKWCQEGAFRSPKPWTCKCKLAGLALYPIVAWYCSGSL